MKKAKPEEMKIFVQSSPHRALKDYRVRRNFSPFGNIMDVARQYGIKVKVFPNGLECSAPKIRLQMFAEKLHFSHVPYQSL